MRYWLYLNWYQPVPYRTFDNKSANPLPVLLTSLRPEFNSPGILIGKWRRDLIEPGLSTILYQGQRLDVQQRHKIKKPLSHAGQVVKVIEKAIAQGVKRQLSCARQKEHSARVRALNDLLDGWLNAAILPHAGTRSRRTGSLLFKWLVLNPYSI